MNHTERFAPSPTGPLHLGHAFSALTAFEKAQLSGGTFLLRIEDIDQTRVRPAWVTKIFDDLQWLGISWTKPVLYQSTRLTQYRVALQQLWDLDLLYSCRCTRRDIEASTSAPQEGIRMFGPDGLIYPGTCRPRKKPANSSLPLNTALRLNTQKATLLLGDRPLTYQETGPDFFGHHHFKPADLVDEVGDIVLARRDMGTSYHLSVVLDDAFQKVTHVTRGLDLVEATKIHVLLQHLLSVPTPSYHHHRLIRDEASKRLAKRDDARAILTYRAEGATPEDIRHMIGL